MNAIIKSVFIRAGVKKSFAIKSCVMVALVALFLGMLGFYDNLSQAGATENDRILTAQQGPDKQQKIAIANNKTTRDILSPIAQKAEQNDSILNRIALIDKVSKSEQRIKTNITHLEDLPNGLKLYSYKFRTDPNVYVGLLATDLAATEEFRKFVVHMGDEFYTINYPALKLHQSTLADYKKKGRAVLYEDPNIAISKRLITKDAAAK